MDTSGFQVQGEWKGRGAKGGRENREGGKKGMGRGVATGESWMVRGGHGMGACLSTAAVCGDGASIWPAPAVCVRSRQGMRITRSTFTPTERVTNMRISCRQPRNSLRKSGAP